MIGVWVAMAVVLSTLAVALVRGVHRVGAEATGLVSALDALLSDARPALALLRTEDHRTRDRLAAGRWGREPAER